MDQLLCACICTEVSIQVAGLVSDKADASSKYLRDWHEFITLCPKKAWVGEEWVFLREGDSQESFEEAVWVRSVKMSSLGKKMKEGWSEQVRQIQRVLCVCRKRHKISTGWIREVGVGKMTRCKTGNKDEVKIAFGSNIRLLGEGSLGWTSTHCYI